MTNYPCNPGWHTLNHLAVEWGKALCTLQLWCRNGAMIEYGFKVMQLSDSPSGIGVRRGGRAGRRWLVYIPDDDPLAAINRVKLASTESRP